MTIWADYSSGRPGGAALRTAGIAGVIRYVGVGSASKRITAAEYVDLTTFGIQVLLVVELGVHDAEGGYAAGVSNAKAALADAHALGIPDSVGIAAASDEHLTAAQVPIAVDYVRGFRDVLGQARTGAYGFAEFVDAVHAAGCADWWWKCGSAPTASEAPWVSFWQRNSGQATETINKVVVDLNEQDNPVTKETVVTNPFTANSASAPILDANGNYTGRDAPVATSFAEDERFTNASVRWIIEDWIPKVNAVLAALQAAQAGQSVPATQLTGTAVVTVSLAPVTI